MFAEFALEQPPVPFMVKVPDGMRTKVPAAQEASAALIEEKVTVPPETVFACDVTH